MSVSLVCAYSKKTRGIGYKNSLPWNTILKGDFRIFIYSTKMALNLDKMKFETPKSKPIVIMGRKTMESLEKIGSIPLKGRENIVITSSPSLVDIPGAEPITSLVDFIKKKSNRHLSIIGGQQLYSEAIEKGYVDYMILTEVSHEDDLEFDTFLCDIPEKKYTFKGDITSLIISEMRNSPCVPSISKKAIGEMEGSLKNTGFIIQNGFKYRVLLYINKTNKENSQV